MAAQYLVRYGVAGLVGRFSAEGDDYRRGQTVVIRSHRGTELGEVLVPVESSADGPANPPILRLAGPDDLARARATEEERDDRFARCLSVFQDGTWPLELIDVEPLLDPGRTVLHYLGPHRLDVGGILAAFRARCGLDVMLEAVGRDVSDEDAPEPSGCGQCGHGEGGCGSSGGCGSADGAEHGGCADCGVKSLLAGSRRTLAAR
jgi:cell fate regulator YaaT (PSP1 superfamily)